MTSALIVLGGLVYIGLSILFHFTPRLRVVVALVVGGLLAGVVVTQVNKWLAKGITSRRTGRRLDRPGHQGRRPGHPHRVGTRAGDRRGRVPARQGRRCEGRR